MNLIETPENFKSGYVAIIGLPNAGKSTLLNALLNIKLSIISAKPQTTRRRVLGILNKAEYQVVFIDTPGIIKPKYKLHTRMMEQVHTALQDADLLALIVDATEHKHPVEVDLEAMNPKKKPALLLLNKVDLINKQDLLPLIDQYREFYPFEEIIPISALKRDGVDQVEQEIVKRLPQHPPFYPPDVLSDQPERFFVAEIIREKIFERFFQEVPYSTEVVVEEFKERPGSKDYIYAIIYVERPSQKGIIIGKKGEALKKIGEAARREIEEFLGRKIYLELRVKVNENWRYDERKLKRLGY
ncbi:GTPase Era [Caldithrix abyssi]|uniref:GTPase Era n=1 Tax=Caldithrix abyssi DSM 13497 TaxID=880073 RepID=H1XTQ4_CALAY|nr:GTPase Era [Caldithrix abyssi]APF17427.1 era GTP-binding protein Era [Caldithrix abyssi DSM 13497]EHO41529.1 GTP-binding protein Era-like-protein [Caldithrix abyssi DSM 13497]